MPKPYLGITGFTTPQETAAIAAALPREAGRRVMFGVLADAATLEGGLGPSPRYPRREDVATLLSAHPRAFNAVHYRPDSRRDLHGQLQRVAEIAGPRLAGIQINAAWPSPQALTAFRGERPEIEIILQIGRRALQIVGDSPARLTERITLEYAGTIDHVLLDASGGEGLLFDTDRSLGFLKALRDQRLDLGLGIAGGLSASTLGLAAPLIAEIPLLSLDAEGRLRDAEDRLSLRAAEKYLEAVLRLVASAAAP
ncbi:MAG TPA: hypothetical protein VF173_10440 [Thermoanaerobaculia bacterium]|nr:hypothetical protein [Thermoanaerobaculia bacterium]